MTAATASRPLSVVAASGWVQEVRIGEGGGFAAAFPWRGVYAVEVSHVDRTRCTRGGKAYDVEAFATTLSLAQTEGLGLPPSAAKPNGGNPSHRPPHPASEPYLVITR